MAVVYKNARQAIGTSYATVYTCPPNTTALVLLAQVSTTANTYVSCRWLDSSQGFVATNLAVGLVVPQGTAQGVLDGPLVLESGDTIEFSADLASYAMVTLSVREES